MPKTAQCTSNHLPGACRRDRCKILPNSGNQRRIRERAVQSIYSCSYAALEQTLDQPLAVARRRQTRLASGGGPPMRAALSDFVQPLAPSGVGSPWAPHGSPWIPVALPHGSPRVPMGFPWAPMGPQAPRGSPWAPHGSPWRPCAAPWVPMGPNLNQGSPWGPHGVPVGSPLPHVSPWVQAPSATSLLNLPPPLLGDYQ